MSIQPTIFGGDTGMTYEDLQRKRAMADQLIAGQQRAPRNVGEGLTAIGNALAARGLRKQAEKRDKELRGEFNDQWASLFNGGVPGGMSDVVPQGGMGAASYTPAKPNTPEYPVGDAGPSPRETAGDYTMGKTVAGHDHAVHAGQDHADWLKYANQGATRNQPLSEDLVGALSFLPDLGVEMRVVSGGQAAKGTGGARTGSTRHDHGNAADVDFYKDGRKLDWNNPQDVPLFQEIVRQASARGVTGFGAGDDYMGAGRMHIGFGDKAVWGAGGKGANAPDWLRSASQGGGQMGGSFQPGQGTQTAQAGGMNLQTLAEIASSPYASAGQKFMAQQLLQQQMQAMDPNTQLDYQLKQAQLANATREPERKVIPGADGYNYYQDSGERVLPGVEKPAPTPPGSVQEYQFYQQQATASGQQPMPYQDWLLSKEKAGANNNTMTTTLGGESTVAADEAELRKKLGGREGEAWAGYMDQADAAAGTMQDMELLNELIALAPQGPISGRIAEMFPGANSAADAFNSVVKRVAPTLRVPGSGSQSDIEYEGMLKSMPQLRARPEANAAISAMMQAKAAINMERGEIVRAYQNEDITVQTARKRLTELNNRSIMTPELLAIIRQVGPTPQSSAAPSDRELTEDDLKWLEGN